MKLVVNNKQTTMVDTVVANAVPATTPAAAPVKARRQKKAAAAPAPAPAAPAPVVADVPVAATNGHSNGSSETPAPVDDLRTALKSILDQQDALKVQVRNILRLHKLAVQQAVETAVANVNAKRTSRKAAKSADAPRRHVVAAMYEMRPEFASFLMTLDPARERVSDRSLISRPQATKNIWNYIKSHGLQNKYADNKSRIQVDSVLASVLHLDPSFELTNKSLQTVLARLFYPREPKATATASASATVA